MLNKCSKDNIKKSGKLQRLNKIDDKSCLIYSDDKLNNNSFSLLDKNNVNKGVKLELSSGELCKTSNSKLLLFK